jgi:hypothetical protein
MAGNKSFLAYLIHRRQDFHVFVVVWVVLAVVWLLFPAYVNSDDRYSNSIRFIVTYGWPIWLAAGFIAHKGWKRTYNWKSRK